MALFHIAVCSLVALVSANHHGDHSTMMPMMSSMKPMMPMVTKMSFNIADADRDGMITKKEWEFFFHNMDMNDDGMITPKEYIGKMMGYLNLSYRDAARMFIAADCSVECDGAVKKEDYQNIWKEMAELGGKDSVGFDTFKQYLERAFMKLPTLPPRPTGMMPMADLESAFHVLNINGDGMLKEDELEGYFKTLAGKDDGVTPEKFIGITMHLMKMSYATAVRLFIKSDCADKCNGKIEDDDVKKIWKNLSGDMDSVDLDGFKKSFSMVLSTLPTMPPYTATTMSPMPVADAKLIASMLDQNKDGMIKQTELEHFFKNLDANGDGSVSATEYIPKVSKDLKVSATVATQFFIGNDCTNKCDDMVGKDDIAKMWAGVSQGKDSVSVADYIMLLESSLKNLPKLPDSMGGKAQEYGAAFDAMDKDGDKMLSLMEYKASQERLIPEGGEKHKIKEKEYVSAVSKYLKISEALARLLFRRADCQVMCDGSIDGNDMASSWKDLDINHDGKVTRMEYVYILKQFYRQFNQGSMVG